MVQLLEKKMKLYFPQKNSFNSSMVQLLVTGEVGVMGDNPSFNSSMVQLLEGYDKLFN